MLNKEQRTFYDDNGYILVSGMFSGDEMAALRRETHALAERLASLRNIDQTWASAEGVGGGKGKTALQGSHSPEFYSAAFTRLILDERLTGAASSIIGPNVQLHHTKFFIKPPAKGSPFPMHQDQPYFPHDRHSMIAAIIHFDDAPLEKGCVRVVPGSHKLGPLPHIGEGGWHLSPETYAVEEATPLPAQAGDVLFFSYLTVHGSGVNTSAEARTTLLVQMRDPQDPPAVRTHESRGQGLMLRGIDPSSGATQPLSESTAGVAMGMGAM